MDNTKLTDRKSQLETRVQELTKQVEELDKAVQKAIRDREVLVANINAAAGAIQVLNELLDAPKSEDCKCVTPQ